jgi:hypothetical protein
MGPLWFDTGSCLLMMGPIGSAETSVLTNLRCVIIQKTEEFSSTAAEAYDLAYLELMLNV